MSQPLPSRREDFPDIVLRSMSGEGVVPSRGYTAVELEDALLSHCPAEPERPWVVHRTRSERNARDVFGDLTAYLLHRGATSAEWWFRDDSTPEGLEALVVDAGGVTTEDQVCVARTLGGELPRIAEGVKVTLVEDAVALDAVIDIGVEVFDNPAPDDRGAFLAEVLDELDRGTGAWVVGWLDGEPVGRAHVSCSFGVAPLVGAAVLPQGRRRGVYAAMLAARLDLAASVRCHTAISKARRDQSLPTLLRAGFVPIGTERAHLLQLVR